MYVDKVEISVKTIIMSLFLSKELNNIKISISSLSKFEDVWLLIVII